ncbi:hypothetical protein D0683_03545 [Escherichia albertii]|nr:hypothetical protein [Escherichia albertii]
MRRLTRLIRPTKRTVPVGRKAFTPHPAAAPECLMRRLTRLIRPTKSAVPVGRIRCLRRIRRLRQYA